MNMLIFFGQTIEFRDFPKRIIIYLLETVYHEKKYL